MDVGRQLIIEKEQNTIASARKVLKVLEGFKSQNHETDQKLFTINNEVSQILASSEMMLKIIEYSNQQSGGCEEDQETPQSLKRKKLLSEDRLE